MTTEWGLDHGTTIPCLKLVTNSTADPVRASQSTVALSLIVHMVAIGYDYAYEAAHPPSLSLSLPRPC